MIEYLAGVITGAAGMYAALRYVWPPVTGPVGMGCVRCHASLNMGGQTSMDHSDMAVYRNVRDASRAALSHGWKKDGQAHLCPNCAANVKAFRQEAIQ
jgi:hypothetical protein